MGGLIEISRVIADRLLVLARPRSGGRSAPCTASTAPWLPPRAFLHSQYRAPSLSEKYSVDTFLGSFLYDAREGAPWGTTTRQDMCGLSMRALGRVAPWTARRGPVLCRPRRQCGCVPRHPDPKPGPTSSRHTEQPRHADHPRLHPSTSPQSQPYQPLIPHL